MSFIDRFRPKWRHSASEVRSEAVRRLDGDADRSVLDRVAREDEDPGVRRIAIKRLHDADLLASLADAQTDAGLKKMALEKADSLRVAIAIDSDADRARAALAKVVVPAALAEVACNARYAELQLAALERIDDMNAVADVARKATEATVRRAAVDRLSAPSALRAVALGDSDDAIGGAAVAKLDDLDALRSIAKKASRKAVRKKAAERLEALGATTDTDKARRAEQGDVVREIERLVSSRDFERNMSQLRALRERWTQLGDGADERLQSRFVRAGEEIEAQVARHRHEQATAEAGADDSHSRRSELCTRVESLRGARADEELEPARAAWAELGSIADDDPLARRFAAACAAAVEAAESYRSDRDSHDALEKLVVTAEQLATGGDLRSARRKFDDIAKEVESRRTALGLDEVITERLALSRRRLDERSEQDQVKGEARRKENQQKVESLIARATRMATADNLGKAVTVLKDVNDCLEKLGPLPAGVDRDALHQQLDEVGARLHVRVQELRENEDWKRWSNASTREELCAKVEALAEETDLVKVAKQLRDLQKAWAESGPVEKEKFGELRERFHKAAGQLRGRCDEHFKKLDFERQQNLTKKLELCTAAEALKDSTDWKPTADRLKKLQEEWKAIGPVPKTKADKVWERFRGACDVFFERRKVQLDQRSEEWAKNLERKGKMCDRAEELQNSTDWDATASELKRLQADWKTVGPVKRSDGDALWLRFRGACDVFFNRFQRRDEVALEDERARVEGLVAEVEAHAASEAAVEGDALEPVVAATRTAWSEWRKVGRDGDPVGARLDAAVATILTRHPSAFADTELDVTVSRDTREMLASRSEQLVAALDELAKDESPSVEKMAEQIRQALVANKFRDNDADSGVGIELARELLTLESKWRSASPLPGDEGTQLEKRFQQAKAQFEERRKKLG